MRLKVARDWPGVPKQYLKKGAKVYLEGQLQTRKWQDPQGQDRYSTEVVLQGFNSQLTMLDRAGAGGGGGAGADAGEPGDFGSAGPTAPRERKPAMAGAKRDDLDDEIPFRGSVHRVPDERAQRAKIRDPGAISRSLHSFG